MGWVVRNRLSENGRVRKRARKKKGKNKQINFGRWRAHLKGFSIFKFETNINAPFISLQVQSLITKICAHYPSMNLTTILGSTNSFSDLAMHLHNQNENAPLKMKMNEESTTNIYSYGTFRKIGANKEEPSKINGQIFRYKKFIKQKPIHKSIKNTVKNNLVRGEERLTFYRQIWRPLVDYNDLSKNKWEGFEVSLAIVYDWMSEFAALLRISKNSFYRSIEIFSKTYQKQKKIASSKVVDNFACGCLSLAAKLQNSTLNYLQSVYTVNARRTRREEISSAEQSILKQTLQWKIPSTNFIQQDIEEAFREWSMFLEEVSQLKETVSGQIFQLLHFHRNNNYKVKVQILYLIDEIIINQHQTFLQGQYRQPILIAMFLIMVLTSRNTKNQNYLWNVLDKVFHHKSSNSTQHPFLSRSQFSGIRLKCQKLIQGHKIIQILSRIPLNTNYQKLLQKGQQFYLHKVEHY